MNLTKILKKNEIGGGTCSWGECSITKDVHIGTLVELLVDGKFFERSDDQYERYCGYVPSISNFAIGVSPTHPNNKRHGYTSGEGSHEQAIVRIDTVHIKQYRILNGLD